MSASTERKIRQAERSNGTYAKDIAAQKEAAKKKKQQIKWTVIGVVVVLFFAFAIYLNTGALYRSLDGLTVENEEVTVGDTTIKAGSRSFSVAECNYIYNMQYVNLANTYGQYVGLDSTQPLDEQECKMVTQDEDSDEVYTWDDYFRDATESQLIQLAVFADYAEQHDISLTDEDKAEIEETIDAIAEAAKTNNYSNVSKFLAANYGKGVNESVARGILELEALATRVQTVIADAEEHTADELTAKYESVKDTYDKFTYSYYLVAADVEESDDDTTAAPTDAALGAAKQVAEDILKDVNSGTELSEAAKAMVADAEIKEQTALSGSSVESELSEWIKSADRAAGDTAVIDGTTGSYVVIFKERDNNQAPTEESGDQNYCDYVAEQLLDQEVLSKWSEDVYSGLSEAYKASYTGAARYVG